ncbi:hypothetical protein V8C37DRAFT_328362 [Trichoderma ceciliae]
MQHAKQYLQVTYLIEVMYLVGTPYSLVRQNCKTRLRPGALLETAHLEPQLAHVSPSPPLRPPFSCFCPPPPPPPPPYSSSSSSFSSLFLANSLPAFPFPSSGPAPRRRYFVPWHHGLWPTTSAHFPRRHNDPFAPVSPLFPFSRWSIFMGWFSVSFCWRLSLLVRAHRGRVTRPCRRLR